MASSSSLPARHHPAAKAQRGEAWQRKARELLAGAAPLFFGATLTDGEGAAYSSPLHPWGAYSMFIPRPSG